MVDVSTGSTLSGTPEIDYSAWNRFSEGKTPGTTPLPEKMPEYLAPSAETIVVDVGCGWGRAASWLYVHGYSVVGTDINAQEIEQATKSIIDLQSPNAMNSIRFQVDDAAKHIDLPDEYADAVNVNGVLLAMTTQADREHFIAEIYRILKPGGIVYFAEFEQKSDEEYKVDYRKHALISHELGLIVAFKSELGITFKDKTDEQIIEFGKPENIQYFSRHYTVEEMKSLLDQFEILELNQEKVMTRSGKRANGLIVYARKQRSN